MHTKVHTDLFQGTTARRRSNLSPNGGGWHYSLSCPLPLLRRTHPPSLLICCFFVSAKMGATRTASRRLEVNLFLSGKRDGKSHFGKILASAVAGICRFCIASRSLLPVSMEMKPDPREPVLLMALKIMPHAKLCLSVRPAILVRVLAPKQKSTFKYVKL